MTETTIMTDEQLREFDRSVFRNAYLCKIKSLMNEDKIDEANKVMDYYVDVVKALDL